MLRQSSSSEIQRTGFPRPFLKKPQKLSGLLWRCPLLPKRWDPWHPQAGPTLIAGAAAGLGLCLGSPAAGLGRREWLFEIRQSQMPLI